MEGGWYFRAQVNLAMMFLLVLFNIIADNSHAAATLVPSWWSWLMNAVARGNYFCHHCGVDIHVDILDVRVRSCKAISQIWLYMTDGNLQRAPLSSGFLVNTGNWNKTKKLVIPIMNVKSYETIYSKKGIAIYIHYSTHTINVTFTSGLRIYIYFIYSFVISSNGSQNQSLNQLYNFHLLVEFESLPQNLYRWKRDPLFASQLKLHQGTLVYPISQTALHF